MPRIIALHKREATHVNLDSTWRLSMGVTTITVNSIKQHALAVVWRYTPAQGAIVTPQGGLLDLTPFARIPLAWSIIDFAPDPEAVQRVADVAVGLGSLEEDQTRTVEAMRMFQNMQPAPRQQALMEAIEEAKQAVACWWWIRNWMAAGMKETITAVHLGTDLTLVGG